MARWTVFKPRGHFQFDAKTIRRHWARLHAADCAPLPEDGDLLEAWTHFHNGHFEQACQLGLALGSSGFHVANKATCVYAAQLEPQASTRQALLQTVAERSESLLQGSAQDPNAHYLLALSLQRYSQGITVAQALAQGLGSRIKTALEAAIALQPLHADAHFALGAFHADIIDKVGILIGNMTYGARKDVCLDMFQRGFALQPRSPFGLMEYAMALWALEGDAHAPRCEALYREAAALKPLDAQHFLEITAAKSGFSP